MSTVTATTSPDDQPDPLACADCLAGRDLCRFHAGWQAGWDDAAEVVGALVLESQPTTRPPMSVAYRVVLAVVAAGLAVAGLELWADTAAYAVFLAGTGSYHATAGNLWNVATSFVCAAAAATLGARHTGRLLREGRR